MVMKNHIFICRNIKNDHSFGVFYGENPLKFSFPLILLEVSFVIVITHVVRFILKPLRQPKVISQIIVSFFFICFITLPFILDSVSLFNDSSQR